MLYLVADGRARTANGSHRDRFDVRKSFVTVRAVPQQRQRALMVGHVQVARG